MLLDTSLIDGELITLSSLPNISVTNPANNEVIAELTCTSDAELALAVASAKVAFEVCKDVLAAQDARVMMCYQQLHKEHHDDIATLLSSETGKTFADAKDDVSPTVFDDVREDMVSYQKEIFGPVLCCMTVNTLEEAIALVNRKPYGNGTSIFTAIGGAARTYQHEIEVGQVGINVPIPVPLPFFSFTGGKNSFYGDLYAYGKQAVRFYTETKTVTARWFEDDIPSGPNMTISLT